METIKIAIIDDLETERLNLSNALKLELNNLGYLNVEFSLFESGEQFLKNYQFGVYNLIFFDIYMDGINGIETAKKVREIDKDVKMIFCSTSNEFASESYAVHADYYFLKPWTNADIAKILNQFDFSDIENSRELILGDDKTILISDIVYTSFSGHYVNIYLEKGKETRTRTTQTNFEKSVSHLDNFIFPCKGIVVNLDKVEKIENDKFVMKSGINLPISRRKYAEVKKVYLSYLISKLRKSN